MVIWLFTLFFGYRFFDKNFSFCHSSLIPCWLCGMLCSFELIVACWWCCLLLWGDVHYPCCVGSASLLSFLANNRMSCSYSMLCLIAKRAYRSNQLEILRCRPPCMFPIYLFVIFIKIPDVPGCMSCCLKIMVVSNFYCHWWKIKINF